MRLSFITDEVTQCFEEAVAFALENGLQGLELRSVEGRPIDEIPLHTLRIWRRRLDAAGLRVPSLAGSFYKCSVAEAGSATQLDKLRRLCDAADLLGCDMIRGFAFFRPQQGTLDSAQLASLFAQPAETLRTRGKRLLLEADPSVNTTNHAALAGLLALLDPALFGAVYDPGNDLFDPLGEKPFPDGYTAISPYLRHVHIKDAVYDDTGAPQCVAPGQGLVGFGAVLARLHADGYNGWLSLEPHYRKGSALTEEQMRLPQGGEFSAGGLQAGRESAAALHALLQNTGWKPEAAL